MPRRQQTRDQRSAVDQSGSPAHESRKRNPYTIEVLRRAVEILSAFSHARPALSLAEIVHAVAAGEPAPAGLSEKEMAAFEQRKKLALAYLIEQSSRPQTIGGNCQTSKKSKIRARARGDANSDGGSTS